MHPMAADKRLSHELHEFLEYRFVPIRAKRFVAKFCSEQRSEGSVLPDV